MGREVKYGILGFAKRNHFKLFFFVQFIWHISWTLNKKYMNKSWIIKTSNMVPVWSFALTQSLRRLLVEKSTWVLFLFWLEVDDESIHIPSINMLLCIGMPCDDVEILVGLSCDNFSKALSLASRSGGLRLMFDTSTSILPSSMLTTEDMEGLRLGDRFVHKRAIWSILMTSSFE